jgi:hypothetical protein
MENAKAVHRIANPRKKERENLFHPVSKPKYGIPSILIKFGNANVAIPMATKIKPNAGKVQFLKPESRTSNTLTKWSVLMGDVRNVG